MEIEIIIKGGEELSKINKKKYYAMGDKIIALVMDGFPQVQGVIISPITNGWTPEKREKALKKQEQKIKQDLIEILKEPEFLERIKAGLTGAA